MMSLKTTLLTCFVALLAVLFASAAHLISDRNSPSALSIPVAAHPEQVNDVLPSGISLPDTTTTSYCVDQNGHCNFRTVQAAVDAVPKYSQQRIVIPIKRGVYNEKVEVPSSKPNITFQGEGYLWTAVVWNDTAKSSHSTQGSASVHIAADNFIAKNISFKAPPPDPSAEGCQAVALRISGDRAAFWGCGFYGYQDTLYDDNGRHYFKDCYIQGTVDYIFGNGQSFYENCQLISVAAAESLACITAHGRNSNSKSENTGFVFVGCRVDGSGIVWLGREWRPYARVVFANTLMSKIVSPEGWHASSGCERTVYFGEYNCEGDGANMIHRKTFVHNLTHSEASPFLTVSFIDGAQWLQPFND